MTAPLARPSPGNMPPRRTDRTVQHLEVVNGRTKPELEDDDPRATVIALPTGRSTVKAESAPQDSLERDRLRLVKRLTKVGRLELQSADVRRVLSQCCTGASPADRRAVSRQLDRYWSVKIGPLTRGECESMRLEAVLVAKDLGLSPRDPEKWLTKAVPASTTAEQLMRRARFFRRVLDDAHASAMKALATYRSRHPVNRS